MTIAPPPVRAASRKLAGLEYAMRLTDDVTPFNVVAVLQIAGDLPVAKLRTALDEWQRRHPLLRTRIVPSGKNYFFHFDVTSPIPLDVSPPSGAEGWITAAQDALHTRFERPSVAGAMPLPPRESGADLIVTVHHTIIDAASATHVFGELLALCAGSVPASAAETAQEGQQPAAALFPRNSPACVLSPRLRSWDGRWRRSHISMARTRCATTDRRYRSLLHPSDPLFTALTASLILASRRQRVTLNAILSAGPWRRYAASSVAAGAAAASSSPTCGRACACLFPTACSVVSSRSFSPSTWNGTAASAPAREIQQSTQRAAQLGERYLSYAMSPGMMKMILGTKAFRMGATALATVDRPRCRSITDRSR